MSPARPHATPTGPLVASTLAARARGAYLGLAIGDALGATVEFMTAAEIRIRHGTHQDLIGGGWLKLKPGQVTDDTQMSLALGAAIIGSGGWELGAIAERWVAWLRSKPIDVGNTCRRGITRVMGGGGLESPRSEGDAGNGALMRNLPTVLFAFHDDDLLVRLSLEQAHITHNHPLSDAAIVCVARMLARLLQGGDQGDCLADCRGLADALVGVHRCFRFDPYPRLASPYVVDTLQTVLHAFFNSASFEECLVKTVNLGGDADTTGAIVGMLAGALYGEAAIPARWLRRLDRDVRSQIESQVDGLLCAPREKDRQPQ